MARKIPDEFTAYRIRRYLDHVDGPEEDRAKHDATVAMCFYERYPGGVEQVRAEREASRLQQLDHEITQALRKLTRLRNTSPDHRPKWMQGKPCAQIIPFPVSEPRGQEPEYAHRIRELFDGSPAV